MRAGVVLRGSRTRGPRRESPPVAVRAAVLGVLVAAVLSACSTPGPTPLPAVSSSGGTITEAQYLAVVRAVHSCMVDKGYDVSDVAKRTDGVTYGFTFGGGTAGSSATGQNDLTGCEQQFGLMQAELAFQDQTALTGAAREAVFADLAACMDAAGVGGVSSADTAEDIQGRIARLSDSGEDSSGAASCWAQFSTQLFGSVG